MTKLGAHRRAQLGIGRTFQNIRLFGTMSAVDNVLAGMHTRLTKSSILGSILRLPGTRRAEREGRERAVELLDFVGIRGREVFAKNLSYGDQRRLEIARALASGPTLLLLDEPTAGMNPQETARLTDLIRRLRGERGISVLLIEHEMRVIMSISDRVTVLDHGEKISEGTPREVREDPRVIRSLPRHGKDGLRRGPAGTARRPQLLREHPGPSRRLAHRREGRSSPSSARGRTGRPRPCAPSTAFSPRGRAKSSSTARRYRASRHTTWSAGASPRARRGARSSTA